MEQKIFVSILNVSSGVRANRFRISVSDEGGVAFKSEEIADAVATQIEALPDLLEASRSAWALIMALPDPDPVWIKTRDRLVAAIAKAEGRS